MFFFYNLSYKQVFLFYIFYFGWVKNILKKIKVKGKGKLIIRGRELKDIKYKKPSF